MYKEGSTCILNFNNEILSYSGCLELGNSTGMENSAVRKKNTHKHTQNKNTKYLALGTVMI